jgi:hypothetical protein
MEDEVLLPEWGTLVVASAADRHQSMIDSHEYNGAS